MASTHATSVNALSIVKRFPATLDDSKHDLRLTREALLEELQHPHNEPPAGQVKQWSAEEIAFHLYMVERGIARGLQKRLAAVAESGQPVPPAPTDELEKAWQRQHAGFTDRSKKAVAPDIVQPLDAPPIEETVRLLGESRTLLLSLVEQYTYDQFAAVTMPHALFGVLLGPLWLNMIAEHEACHTEQLRALRA